MSRQQKYHSLTVSGFPGAGSSTLAKLLAKELGWKVFCGGDFMREHAIKKGVFDKDNNFHHDATVYGDEFDREVDFGMRRKLMQEKGSILDAWLSGFMAQGIEGVLKVLVTCSNDAVRVDRIVNRDRVSVAKAKKHIFNRERKNLEKWRRLYANEWQQWVVEAGKMDKGAEIDFWNPKLYDLVIDTYSLSREETVEVVLEGI
jgi:CMP/dCMP kinase